MRYFTFIVITLWGLMPCLLQAKEASGTLSVFMIKSGKPLVNNEIIIDATRHIRTDSDGSIKIKLTVGKHQIEIFGKSANGKNLGYFKKPIVIKEGKDTQIVASFTMDEPEIDIDTPIGKIKDEKKDKAKGKATLRGTVLTSDKGLAIANARVFVKGTDIDARTDSSGNFSVEIPADSNVSISVVHSAYSAQTLNNIKVEKDGSISKIIKLTPASLELEEFVVLGPKVQGNIADIMQEEKEGSAIANILGSAEMSKKGDSDAASALKRVTGITLVGGRNIYVRGLGDRYSNIEMNSMPLPSPDPTKRSVPLDIFPASVIGSLKVQKSASADIPSSFGGGYIDIRTKDSIKEDYIKISLNALGNSNTGRSTDTYVGSATDWLGFDNGYRAITNEILNAAEINVGERIKGFTPNYFTEEELVRFTTDYVDRNYQTSKRNLPMGFSGSLEAGKVFEFKDDHKVSVFANYGYSQNHEYRREQFFGYDMGVDGTLNTEAITHGINDSSTSNYYQGGSFNLAYSYLDVLNIKYTKLYTRNALKSTRIVDGVYGANFDTLTNYFLDWEERILTVDQINGDLKYEVFNKKAEAEFGMEYAEANLYQPNNFNYTYIEEQGVRHIDNFTSPHRATRLKSDDELYAFYLKNKIFVDWFSAEDKVEFGINYNTKDRVSRQNKFFLRPIGSAGLNDSDLTSDIESFYFEHVRNNIPYADRAFLVSPLFKAADYFDATVSELGAYSSAFIKFNDQVETNMGVRFVDFGQTVYQYKLDRTNIDMAKRGLIEREPTTLEVLGFYPSASLKYKFDKDNHFDTAISKTFIVPDLREFTDGEYFHPYDIATVIGNPNLVNTEIYSLDLKYSHYISANENIKMGLFFKYLDKPIEDVMLPSSALPIYSYDNADSATLYGFEVDGRKNFDFLGALYSKYYFSGNFSYTESEVSLRDEQLEIYSSNNRQLQGLSQTVVNATIGYDDDDRNVALSYNMMGERIRMLGVIDEFAFPDNYETPPQTLDLVVQEKFTNLDSYGLDNLNVRLKIGNILDDETVWRQGANIVNQFKTGQVISFGVSSTF